MHICFKFAALGKPALLFSTPAHFLRFDLELWPMTLTFNPNLAKVKVDDHAKHEDPDLNVKVWECILTDERTDRQTDMCYQMYYFPASLNCATINIFLRKKISHFNYKIQHVSSKNILYTYFLLPTEHHFFQIITLFKFDLATHFLYYFPAMPTTVGWLYPRLHPGVTPKLLFM